MVLVLVVHCQAAVFEEPKELAFQFSFKKLALARLDFTVFVVDFASVQFAQVSLKSSQAHLPCFSPGKYIINMVVLYIYIRI